MRPVAASHIRATPLSPNCAFYPKSRRRLNSLSSLCRRKSTQRGAWMRSPEDVYRRFINFEEQAAAIYLRMASRFLPENPDMGALCLEMGIQEKQHAGLLQFCLAEELFAAKLPSDRQ